LVHEPDTAPREGFAYINCGQCLTERPADVTPQDWARLSFAYTPKGFQVWCVRHDRAVDTVTIETALDAPVRELLTAVHTLLVEDVPPGFGTTRKVEARNTRRRAVERAAETVAALVPDEDLHGRTATG
jgi:hypothetical protein